MLTVIEKIEQRKLAKNGEDEYTIVYEVEHRNGNKEEITLKIHATDQDFADDLGKKIQIRHQVELNEGETKLERWGLGLNDIFSHKMGFIIPWKDPVYKRSMNKGLRIPLLRAKATFNDLIALGSKKTKRVELASLTKAEINLRKQRNIIRYFAAALMAILTIFSIINAFNSQGLNRAPFLLSSICTAFIAAMYIFQALYTRKKLNQIGGSENE